MEILMLIFGGLFLVCCIIAVVIKLNNGAYIEDWGWPVSAALWCLNTLIRIYI